MGYLSCRADSSIATCRSFSAATVSDPQQVVPGTNNNNDGKTSKKKKKTVAAGTPDGKRSRPIHHFTYRELEAATCNFSDKSLLGRGSHGAVYKAVLHSGRLVAVKRPSRVHHSRHPSSRIGGGNATASSNTPSSSRVIERNEVENEIEILSKIHSPRLVNLVGFSINGCDDEAGAITSLTPSPPFQRERLLVMEHMPNGTLYDLLHSNPRPPGWARRLRLAIQTAKAIRTLHSYDPQVIHRDVKAANVLIDHNFNARLGDFGLAVCENGFSSSVKSTPPAGTFGYLDPCYITPENLSTKIDVFSFGILLLEIMSGRKAMDVAHSPPSIVEWAVPLLRKGKILALYDPRILPPRDPAARRQLASLAASCVRSCGERRPLMEEVVDQLKILSKTVPSKGWNGISVTNPCLVVETERTHIKLNQELDANPNSSPHTSCMRSKEKRVEAEDMGMGKKKPPSSGKGVRPLRNTKRVFSDGSPTARNLMELLKAPDEETIKMLGVGVIGRQVSCISRARTLHLSDDYGDKGTVGLKLRRNQSLRGGVEV